MIVVWVLAGLAGLLLLLLLAAVIHTLAVPGKTAVYRPDPAPRTLEQWLRLEGLGEIRGHEFHYYDTTDNGSACTASRKWKNRSWACMQLKDNLFAGFPHLYYYSNPKLPERFLRACLDFRKLREAANRPEF